MSNGTGSAFVKGGCGCLLAFLVLGMLAVMLGGHMHIDIGGAILLFVIGGVIGLVVLAIYGKGQRDAADRRYASREERDPYSEPEPAAGGERGRAWRFCPHCGARINPTTGEGLHSPVGEDWLLICDRCRNEIELEH
jgi:hypothetical protein